MRYLPGVTLCCVDCVDLQRLVFPLTVCLEYCRFDAVKVLTSCDDTGFPYRHLLIKIPRLDVEGYSRFMIQDFHAFIDTPYCLVIQWDGFILNPNAWDDRYFDYDFVGAPWPIDESVAVGNGGFSLRSKRLLSLTPGIVQCAHYWPEDIRICQDHRRALEEQGIRFAPRAIADRFSMEGYPHNNRLWDGQFGFHGVPVSTYIDRWCPPAASATRPDLGLDYRRRHEILTSPSFLRSRKRPSAVSSRVSKVRN
jgi:hypothetical protein